MIIASFLIVSVVSATDVVTSGEKAITTGITVNVAYSYLNKLTNSTDAIWTNSFVKEGVGSQGVSIQSDKDYEAKGIKQFYRLKFDSAASSNLQFIFFNWLYKGMTSGSNTMDIGDLGLTVGSSIKFGGFGRGTDGRTTRMYVNQYRADGTYIRSDYAEFVGDSSTIKSFTKTATLDPDCQFIRLFFGAGTIRAGTSDVGGLFIIPGTSDTYLTVHKNPNDYSGNPKWYKKKWSAVGDSITSPRIYPEFVRRNLGFLSINNYGVSGTRMSSIAGSPNDADSIIKRWNRFDTNVDLMTIYAGINDYHGSVPIGNIDTSTSATEFYGAYKTVIEGLLKKNPAMRLVLITPMQKYDASAYTGENANGEGLKPVDYRNAVIKLAERYSLPYLDLYQLSGISKFTAGIYLKDGLHPNDAGNKRIADLLTEYLLML